MDLGGIHSPTEQFIDLDRFGLADGGTYSLDFFYVERHRPLANFMITTNFVLKSVPIPTISAAFD